MTLKAEELRQHLYDKHDALCEEYNNTEDSAILEQSGMETCPRCGTVSHRGYGLICTCLVSESRSTPHETPSDNEPSQDIRERPRYETEGRSRTPRKPQCSSGASPSVPQYPLPSPNTPPLIQPTSSPQPSPSSQPTPTTTPIDRARLA
jgi:hypothetical protein